MDATARAAADQKARQRVEKERQARFRAWWNGLSPEAQRAEIKAGHVLLLGPVCPEKRRKPRKRTRAKQRQACEVEALRHSHGEAYVHATPLQRFGVGLRAAIAARAAAA